MNLKTIGMKIAIFHLGAIVFLSSLTLSCTKDFDKINTNPNNVAVVTPSQLFPAALVNSQRYNMTRNRNFNNELMQVTVAPSEAEGTVFRYDFRATWSDYLWNGLYSELINFKDMYYIDGTNKSYKGVSLISQAWLFSILTDTYGDIPFKEALSAKKEYGNIKEPVFDVQKDIYIGLFDMLEEANTLLAANETMDATRDPVYQGNVAAWRRFGNSLYLRLLLRVSGKAEVAERCKSKIKEIIDANPAQYPVFTSTKESAFLKWTGAGPYVSPYFGIREQDFRQPGLASFFIEKIRDWNDPRLNINTYGRGGVNRWGIAQGTGGFAGIPSGYAQGDAVLKQSYFYSMTTPANNLQTDSLTGIMMTYGELCLIKAEAALKGWIGGSVETFYNKGVEAGIQYWLTDWPKEPGVTINTYLTDADIDWNEGLSFDQKMEMIHLQKYFVLFLTDMQQWFEYRRTGHPVLPKGPGLRNGGVMPARMIYPVYVQSTNPTNYKKAVTAQGADLISTQVWWQKP